MEIEGGEALRIGFKLIDDDRVRRFALGVDALDDRVLGFVVGSGGGGGEVVRPVLPASLGRPQIAV